MGFSQSSLNGKLFPARFRTPKKRKTTWLLSSVYRRQTCHIQLRLCLITVIRLACSSWNFTQGADNAAQLNLNTSRSVFVANLPNVKVTCVTVRQRWLTFLCFCVAMSRQERSWKSSKKWRFVTDPPRPERFSLWCQDAERRWAWRRRRDRRGGWREAQVTSRTTDTSFCPKSHPIAHCNAQFPLSNQWISQVF